MKKGTSRLNLRAGHFNTVTVAGRQRRRIKNFQRPQTIEETRFQRSAIVNTLNKICCLVDE